MPPRTLEELQRRRLPPAEEEEEKRCQVVRPVMMMPVMVPVVVPVVPASARGSQACIPHPTVCLYHPASCRASRPRSLWCANCAHRALFADYYCSAP